jgi:PAS domain S-box-containing protein
MDNFKNYDNLTRMNNINKLKSRIDYLTSFPELDPMIIVEIDKSGKIMYFNSSAKNNFPDLETLNIEHPYLEIFKKWKETQFSEEYLKYPYEIQIGNKYYLQHIVEIKDNERMRFYGTDITETKKAQNMIQKQNAILKSIIESANTPIFSVDANYRYTSFNSSHAMIMKKMHDVDIELGKNMLDYHADPKNRKSAKQNIDTCLKGESFSVEAWIGEKENLNRFFEISHNPVKGEDDQIMGVAIFAKDATERKNIEETLLRSKNELEERVRERTEDLQIANDFLNNEIYARKKAEQRLAERLKELQCLYRINSLNNEPELKLDELYKKAIFIIPYGYHNPESVEVRITVGPDIYQTSKWEKVVKRQFAEIRSGILIIGKIEVGFSNDQNLSDHWSGILKDEKSILDAIGELLGSIALRKKTELDLIESRQRLMMAVQVSGSGIYEFTTNPVSFYCNSRLVEMLGYSLEELPKDRKLLSWYLSRIHSEDLNKTILTFKINYQKKDQRFDQELRIKHKNGEWKYIHNISTSTISGKGIKPSNHIFGILTDVTESKQIERSIILNNEIMKLFWLTSNVKEYLKSAIDLIHQWSRCCCAGIRLLDPDTGNIPYVSYKGFDEIFIKQENSISLKADNCFCIRAVANSYLQQESVLLTPGGSLFLRNSPEYLESLSPEIQEKYRGTCIQSGYKTIAIIPIRHHQIMFGVIHLTDKNISALSMKEIETLEQVADLIGQGLYRFDIEERIKNSQQRLANAQKIAHLGDWDWDLRNNKLHWSDEVYSIFGKKPQGFQATYQIFLSFIHADDRDLFKKNLDSALYKQQPFNIEHRILLSDGTTGYVHQQAMVNYDETGQPQKITGTIQDITFRKLMEKQLLETSNYARTLVEVNLDPLMTISAEGKIMDVNKSTEAATGLERNQLIGTDFANYFEDPPKAREVYQRVFSEGYVRDYPLVLRNKNGKTFEVLYNASLYRNNSGQVEGVFAAARDVTQLRKIEEELHALSRQIVTAQENERRAIARELHDEIGQSLTALKIMLSQAVRLSDEKRENSLKEAHSLASELLQQVREMSLKLRPSMLDDLGLLPTLIWYFDRITSQTGIKINFEHDGLQVVLPPEVNTTVYRIIQEALTNVIRHAGVREAGVNIFFYNDVLFIKIEDNGLGFSLPETNTKITSGLSGMRERVLLLGGKIELDTAPNQGTRVLVELPIINNVSENKKTEINEIE